MPTPGGPRGRHLIGKDRSTAGFCFRGTSDDEDDVRSLVERSQARLGGGRPEKDIRKRGVRLWRVFVVCNPVMADASCVEFYGVSVRAAVACTGGWFFVWGLALCGGNGSGRCLLRIPCG